MFNVSSSERELHSEHLSLDKNAALHRHARRTSRSASIASTRFLLAFHIKIILGLNGSQMTFYVINSSFKIK